MYARAARNIYPPDVLAFLECEWLSERVRHLFKPDSQHATARLCAENDTQQKLKIAPTQQGAAGNDAYYKVTRYTFHAALA